MISLSKEVSVCVFVCVDVFLSGPYSQLIK